MQKTPTTKLQKEPESGIFLPLYYKDILILYYSYSLTAYSTSTWML